MPSGADEVTLPERDEAQAARRMDRGDPADTGPARDPGEVGSEPVHPFELDPEHARSDRAGETPPHPDA